MGIGQRCGWCDCRDSVGKDSGLWCRPKDVCMAVPQEAGSQGSHPLMGKEMDPGTLVPGRGCPTGHWQGPARCPVFPTPWGAVFPGGKGVCCFPSV